MLSYLRVVRSLRNTAAGKLLPWMGPALRGILARALKQRVCVHPPQERDTRWVHCQGCPHMRDCPYGQTFEPDPPADVRIFQGQEQAARPLVASLPFPMPVQVAPGRTVPLTLILLGQSAQSSEKEILQALEEAGEQSGFYPLRTQFVLDAEEQRLGPQPIELPLTVEGPMIERIRVRLGGPLFLRMRSNGGRRRHLAQPSFSDLLRASLRTLGTLFSLYAEPLPADFAGLKQESEGVPLLEANYESFHQEHRSARSGQRTLHGVMGSGVYGPVPQSLVSWLEWGGRVHVGTERVAGAGGWEVER